MGDEPRGVSQGNGEAASRRQALMCTGDRKGNLDVGFLKPKDIKTTIPGGAMLTSTEEYVLMPCMGTGLETETRGGGMTEKKSIDCTVTGKDVANGALIGDVRLAVTETSCQQEKIVNDLGVIVLGGRTATSPFKQYM